VAVSLIFVDTGAWYAYVDASDAHHLAAVRFINTLTGPLITSSYIFDETVTLIRMHLGHHTRPRS
jgi:predicted nucleic acid-binding protein